MTETLTVSDPELLKALAHPLRLAALHAFATPKTAKQVAAELGIAGTKLYHHVELLERAGFLKLVQERPNRGTTERYLVTTARRITAELGSPAAGQLVFVSALREIERAILEAPLDGIAPLLMRAGVRISPERLDEFQEAFGKLVKEYSDQSGAYVGLALALYPLTSNGATKDSAETNPDRQT